jgi:hypothetical protein
VARLAPSRRLLAVSLCGCCPDLSGRDVYIGWLNCTMALSSVVDGCLLSSVVAVVVDDCLYRSLFGGEGSGWCLVAPLPVLLFDVAVVMLLGLRGLLLS